MTVRPTTNLVMRNDTILGVCEAIGEDFGFNANWLRLVFAATFYLDPVMVIGTYVGLGLLVAATRYFAPSRLHARKRGTADVRIETHAPLAAERASPLCLIGSPPGEAGCLIPGSPTPFRTRKIVPFRHGS